MFFVGRWRDVGLRYWLFRRQCRVQQRSRVTSTWTDRRPVAAAAERRPALDGDDERTTRCRRLAGPLSGSAAESRAAGSRIRPVVESRSRERRCLLRRRRRA